LGMVRQWEALCYDRRFSSVELKTPDFARLAEAFGAAGFTARRPDELDAVYERALAVTKRPALVHVLTETNENCSPMWTAGQSIDTMVVEDPKYAAKSTKKKS